MNWFIKLFKRKSPEATIVSPMPPWEAIVEMMYDKHLDGFDGEVVKVIYSADQDMRYVVLKKEKGLLLYVLEAIYQFDEDEWRYIHADDGALHAMWEPYFGQCGMSLFETEDELMRELTSEPEYKRFFAE